LNPGEYKSNVKPTWCPGCGNYAVLSALLSAFSYLNVEPDNTVIVSGIGCSSRLPFFTNTYGFHSIHGRALPLSIGLKTANPDRTVVTVGGDGDGFSIGGNHFIHTSRKNPDITYIVMDNEIYGLTKGQNSPTSHDDLITKINPYEAIEERINPVLMALSFDTSYIARGFSGDPNQLKDLIIKGMQHKGFSFIHIMSPCVQYNHKVTYESLKQRIKTLPEGHDTKDRIAGMKLAFTNENLYTGLFYDIEKPTFKEKLDNVNELALSKCSSGNCSLKDIMSQFE
jgi:2-oxoglutarate ferredoxin oxidoreductase subunit beta